MMRALAGLVLLLAAQPVFAQHSYDWGERHHRGSGARILVLRDYHLAEGDTTPGAVIVFGGSATIDGRVGEDVVVMGGTLRLGPHAVVDGDVVTVGGDAIIDPLARINGEVNETVVRWPDMHGEWGPAPRGLFAGLAFAATLLRLFLVLVVASALVLVAPHWIRGIGARVGASPAASAAVGFACEVCFVPVLIALAVALAITLIGIPLIGVFPFLIAAAAVVATAGFTAVAARVGARLRGTTLEESGALFADMLLGFIAIAGVTIVAHIAAFGSSRMGLLATGVGAFGVLIEYLAWTIGIGAATASLLTRWNGPRAAAGVPPITAAPTVI